MFDDTLPRRRAKPTTLVGTLHRNGKTWPLPISDQRGLWQPADVLFMADRLEFPPTTKPVFLSLVIRFSSRQLAGDHQFGPSDLLHRDRARYMLPGNTECPQCGRSAVHPVTISDQNLVLAENPTGEFTRTCDCGVVWLQTGTEWNHYLYGYQFDDDVRC